MLKFWSENRSQFSRQHAVARRVLCIPATPTISEGVFSAAKRVLEKDAHLYAFCKLCAVSTQQYKVTMRLVCAVVDKPEAVYSKSSETVLCIVQFVRIRLNYEL